MNTEMERRVFQSELRMTTDGDTQRLVGYAAKFNVWSQKIYGLFKERIQPGAFSESLKTADVRALFNHDPNFVLGRNKAGTLRLRTDTVGLAVDIDMPATSWAKDLATSVKRGDITQMSFGFKTNKDKWNSAGTERDLIAVELVDVSVVAFPAYEQTEVVVSQRSLLGAKLRLRQDARLRAAEAWMRTHGLGTLVERTRLGQR